MDKSVVGIIDTGFDRTIPILEMWRGFSWAVHDLVKDGSRPHWHGTAVANLLMRAFDTDDRRGRVFFHHIRAGDSNGIFAPDALFEAWQLIEELGCTATNDSFGAPQVDFSGMSPRTVEDYFAEMKKRVQRLVDKGIAVHAASGNSDDVNWPGGDPKADVNYPWCLFGLSRNPIIVGSVQRDGVSAASSSDGPQLNWCFWGDMVLVRMPSGQYAYVSGTSLAAPKSCAVVELMRLERPEWSLDQCVLAVELLAEHGSMQGQRCDKHGWGSPEALYQDNTRYARSRPPQTVVDASLLRPRASYVDFRRTT